jgi:sugar lactone lactonase YvrE
LYVGSLVDGRIIRVNSRNGNTSILPDSAVGKPSVGVDYDKRRRILWVAGGPAGEIRAVHVVTGEVLATYTLPATPEDRFINDLVVTRGAVYATDSAHQELGVVELPASLSLPPSGPATVLPLTGELVYVEGFNANGIVESNRGNWLVLVQGNTGRLFRVNPTTGHTRQIDLGGNRVRNGDGLEAKGDILYVVRNENNRIDVYDLKRNVKSGKRVDVIRSRDFDVPTTAALVRGNLWVVNARFGNTDPDPAPYWLTRVRAYRG